MRLRHLLITSLLITPAFARNKNKPAPVVVHLATADGKDAGTVTFRQEKKGVAVKVDLQNLPMGWHAVHVHAVPKCDAPDFKTAGGHFNPDMKQHGLLNPAGHHNGDLPESVSVNGGGTGSAKFLVNYLSLDPAAANSIFANGGTSIIVHEKKDDMTTDPTGAAGNRIACGVVPKP